jgi:hypothetical protein
MNTLRNKKLQKHIDKIKEWSETTHPLDLTYPTQTHVPASIWEDIDIQQWCDHHLDTPTEKELTQAIFRAPITDTSILQQRQQALLSTKHLPLLLNHKTEQDLKWFIHAKELDKNYLYSVLFPSHWYMRWVKWHPVLMNLYHSYHLYINTLTSLSYPISLLLAPYWLLKNKIMKNFTLRSYIKIITQIHAFIKQQYKPFDYYKFLLGILVYVVFYIYTLIQMIDLTIQLHLFKRILTSKIESLYTVQQQLTSYDFAMPFDSSLTPSPKPFHPTLTTLHKILHTPSLKTNVLNLLKAATLRDILVKFNQRLPPHYTLVKYHPTHTFFHHMKNPMLPPTQVSNPISLHNSIIISGPNAGGKTTYVKTLLWNLLFAQTFGIAYATHATVHPYDAFLHHHRIKDITGDQSLFQAEMNKLQETLTTLNSHQHAIYFMDEPLHSTHPADGAALLKSLILYFKAHAPHLTLILTSHYFSIHDIPKMRYVHVKATVIPPTIQFDYKIYPGPSTQTIGIDLLRQQGFPEEILSTAVNLRN